MVAESLKAMVYFQEGDFAALAPSDRLTLIGASQSLETIKPGGQTQPPAG